MNSSQNTTTLELEVVLLRQALEQAAVDLRGVGAELTGEARAFVFDTACPRIREELANSVDRVGMRGWALLNVHDAEALQ